MKFGWFFDDDEAVHIMCNIIVYLLLRPSFNMHLHLQNVIKNNVNYSSLESSSPHIDRLIILAVKRSQTALIVG